MKITVAGVGYVGLSLAVLLAQNHEVTAITTTEKKAEKLNQFISPIQDDEIERFFREAREGKRALSLHTTTDKAKAYGSAELVIIATPTNYDDVGHFFDTSAVEDAIEWTLRVNPDVLMVIKSTIPVGYTESVKKKYGIKNIIFSPEFLRESKALYDNLHPSRIVVGCDADQEKEARIFADLLLEGARTEEKRSGSAEQNIPVLLSRLTEAEAIKLFANSYLAVRVAYFRLVDYDWYILSLNYLHNTLYSRCTEIITVGLHCKAVNTNSLRIFSQYLVSNKLLPDVICINHSLNHSLRYALIVSQKLLSIFRQTISAVTKGRIIIMSAYSRIHTYTVYDHLCIKPHNLSIGIQLITLEDGSEFAGCKVVNDKTKFKAESDVILANRFDADVLGDVEEKVYTRDLYRRD